MAVRFYVEERTDYNKGSRYGRVGPYEFIRARVETDAGEGLAFVLKPRDPALGNNTLVFEIIRDPKFVNPNDGNLFSAGFTFVSLVWPDATTAPEAAKDVLNFLRVTGGPMLLGDQRQFLKRTIVVDASGWVPRFVASGMNKGTKHFPLIDAAVTPNTASIEGVKVVQAPRAKAYSRLTELHAQLQ
jgi:hypothetical protein